MGEGVVEVSAAVVVVVGGAAVVVCRTRFVGVPAEVRFVGGDGVGLDDDPELDEDPPSSGDGVGGGGGAGVCGGGVGEEDGASVVAGEGVVVDGTSAVDDVGLLLPEPLPPLPALRVPTGVAVVVSNNDNTVVEGGGSIFFNRTNLSARTKTRKFPCCETASDVRGESTVAPVLTMSIATPVSTFR